MLTMNYLILIVLGFLASGTIFSNDNRTLRAVCGSSTPCTLNIEINKGRYMNIRELAEKYLDEINNLKIQIIETKLNLLFGYTEEAEVLKIFTLLRERLGNFTETFLAAIGLFFVLSTFLSNSLSKISLTIQPAERIKIDPKKNKAK